MANNMGKFGINLLQPFEKSFLSNVAVLKIHVAGMKFYFPKGEVDKSEWPENRKLRIVDKQPLYNFKPPKMYKMIKLMRGPEEVHNELIYKGFGVKALLGGRMKYRHFEAIRKVINGRIDVDRMFALWRIDDPWQPLAKKATGKTMGGGKGSIHHYCTPVRADRIIVELGGDLHELEGKKILGAIISILPFPARVVTQKELEEEKQEQDWMSKNNINPYDMEYVIKNNMGGCKRWISPYDELWFGKYS